MRNDQCIKKAGRSQNGMQVFGVVLYFEICVGRSWLRSRDSALVIYEAAMLPSKKLHQRPPAFTGHCPTTDKDYWGALAFYFEIERPNRSFKKHWWKPT